MFKFDHLIDFHNGDIIPLFNDAEAFSFTIDALARLFKNKGIDKVVSLESRGFVLGGAVAKALSVAFVPIRKKGKLKGDVVSSAEFKNYSGEMISLEIKQDSISPGDQILIIDDWFETGNQGRAAISLLEKLGGNVVGIGVVVDDTSNKTREYLQKYNYRYLTVAN